MVKKAEIPQHIIDTAMRLAAERGWRDLSLAEIATAAKLPLSKVHPIYPSKQAILGALVQRIDAAVLEAEEPGALEGPARDRLFDVLMRRFDALQPYRQALGNVLFDQMGDPGAALCGLCRLERSMACMLEAAGLSSSGLRGALRVKALCAAYLPTLRVFLRDESSDMAATMAALDRNLTHLDHLARICSRVQRRTSVHPQET